MNSHAPSDIASSRGSANFPTETNSANLSLPEKPPHSYSTLAIHSLAPHTRVHACRSRLSFVMSSPEGLEICHLDNPGKIILLPRSRFGYGTAHPLGEAIETSEPQGLLLALMGVPGEFCWFSEHALIAAEQHHERIPCLRKQFPILPGTHHFSKDGTLLYAPGQHTAYASVQRVFIEPGATLPLQAEYTWVFRTEGLATASAFSCQNDFLALAVPTWGSDQNSAPTWSLKVFALNEEKHPDPIATRGALPKIQALMWSPCGTKIFAAGTEGEFLELEFTQGRISLLRSRTLVSPIRVFSLQMEGNTLLVGTKSGSISQIDLASLEETPLATLPDEVTSLATQQSHEYLAAVLNTGALHVLRKEEKTCGSSKS